MSIMLRLSVHNRHGVLDQITGIIRRYGWNINEINSGESEPGFSNINIRLKDNGADVQTLTIRLAKLECVRSWEVCDTASHLILELCLLKIAEQDCPPGLLHGGQIQARLDGAVIYAINGLPWEIDQLLAQLAGRVMDCSRSGILCVKREAGHA